MIPLVPLLMHIVYSGLTLYMMLILVRWASPWLQIDLWNHRLRWISQLTDPALDLVRRKLPALGPFDFAPWALLFGIWLVREVAVNIIAGAYTRL